MSDLNAEPVMDVRIRQYGPNGTEKTISNVTGFSRNEEVLEMTVIGPDRDERTTEEFEHANVLSASAKLEGET